MLCQDNSLASPQHEIFFYYNSKCLETWAPTFVSCGEFKCKFNSSARQGQCHTLQKDRPLPVHSVTDVWQLKICPSLCYIPRFLGQVQKIHPFKHSFTLEWSWDTLVYTSTGIMAKLKDANMSIDFGRSGLTSGWVNVAFLCVLIHNMTSA